MLNVYITPCWTLLELLKNNAHTLLSRYDQGKVWDTCISSFSASDVKGAFYCCFYKTLVMSLTAAGLQWTQLINEWLTVITSMWLLQPPCLLFTRLLSVHLSLHIYRSRLAASARRQRQRCHHQSAAPELLPELSSAPPSLPALRAVTHPATLHRDADPPHCVLPRPARSAVQINRSSAGVYKRCSCHTS